MLTNDNFKTRLPVNRYEQLKAEHYDLKPGDGLQFLFLLAGHLRSGIMVNNAPTRSIFLFRLKHAKFTILNVFSSVNSDQHTAEQSGSHLSSTVYTIF